ncbi:MAG: SpoIIE family protein phosphatase [Erysipelotrichaceae bacterium]|nr:SpoIIE family protein phosphatase [Erysipelotrichaceae bacterium]
MEIQKSKSLRRKIFNGTIQVSLVILLLVGAMNYLLFSNGVSSYYRTSVERNASTAAAVINVEDVIFLADSVWEILNETGPRSEDNPAFNGILDTEQYQRTVRMLNTIRSEQNDAFLTLVLADTENMRFVYLADADASALSSNHVSFPGDCYEMSESEKAAVLEYRFYIPTYTYHYDERGKDVLLYSAGSAVQNKTDLSGVIAYIIADVRQESISRDILPTIYQNLFILAGVVLFLAIVVVILGNIHIIDPLNKLSSAARQFIADRKNNRHNEVRYFKALGIKTQDEIEQLARSMSTMEKDLNNYEEEVISLTKDKERIRTELTLARNLQHDTLPTSFPPFPERPEIDVYAVIDPAREVGGDFYDIFLIDDDHLALVVADVSGKGIPAALFMMISKILISTTLKSCLSPARALEKVNALLCENNREQMFVTVWLAVVDLNTGTVTCANAGHENPLICQNGVWSYITDRHGLVLSAMEDMKYSEHTMQLQDGDWLFQYSDGIPEATNINSELFGEQRLLDSCQKASLVSPAGFLKSIQIDIDEFVGEAEQFDDITMLAYRFHQKGGNDNGNS